MIGRTRKIIDQSLSVEGRSPFTSAFTMKSNTSINKKVFEQKLFNCVRANNHDLALYLSAANGNFIMKNLKTGKRYSKNFFDLTSGSKFYVSADMGKEAGDFSLKESQVNDDDFLADLKKGEAFNVSLMDNLSEMYGEENKRYIPFAYLFDTSLYFKRRPEAIETSIWRNDDKLKVFDHPELAEGVVGIRESTDKDEIQESYNFSIIQKYYMNGQFSGVDRNPFFLLDEIAGHTDVLMYVYYKEPALRYDDGYDSLKLSNSIEYRLLYLDPQVVIQDKKTGEKFYVEEDILKAINIMIEKYMTKYVHKLVCDKEENFSERFNKFTTLTTLAYLLDNLVDYITIYDRNGFDDESYNTMVRYYSIMKAYLDQQICRLRNMMADIRINDEYSEMDLAIVGSEFAGQMLKENELIMFAIGYTEIVFKDIFDALRSNEHDRAYIESIINTEGYGKLFKRKVGRILELKKLISSEAMLPMEEDYLDSQIKEAANQYEKSKKVYEMFDDSIQYFNDLTELYTLNKAKKMTVDHFVSKFENEISSSKSKIELFKTQITKVLAQEIKLIRMYGECELKHIYTSELNHLVETLSPANVYFGSNEFDLVCDALEDFDSKLQKAVNKRKVFRANTVANNINKKMMVTYNSLVAQAKEYSALVA